ncbi:MAG: ABC transporter permease [Verrucomicrobia bacterium]|nr:ABC transporter permease [Verrucomicrobiota bacterium]
MTASAAPPRPASAPAARLAVRAAGDDLVVEFGGDWKNAPRAPGVADLEAQLAAGPHAARWRVVGRELGPWDSRLLAVVLRVVERGEHQGRTVDIRGVPEGLQKLVRLARAVPERTDVHRGTAREPWRQRLGEGAMARARGVRDVVAFVGECAQGVGRLVRGRAQYRWRDAWVIIQESGAEALPIVLLINLLVGLILGFVGAVQLARFGASIYVADLVGIAVTREMGCMMTGIIMCGRTGAAFAAQLGTMKVNEEIDAFRALAISPTDFLVLPRVVALALMMPLLVVFGNLMGILGGMAVALAMLDLSLVEYWNETVAAVTLTNYLLGVAKGACFGILVAVTGCLRGIQCGSNAAAVGHATTSAVVTGITAIIAADALCAVLCNVLGI